MNIYRAAREDHDKLVEFFAENDFGLKRRAWFDWKHLDNPCGQSIILVAEERGKPVATVALVPALFHYRGHQYTALLTADALIAPRMRGKRLYSHLMAHVLQYRPDDCIEPCFFIAYPGPLQAKRAHASAGWKLLATSRAWTYVFGVDGMGTTLTRRARYAPLGLLASLTKASVRRRAGETMHARALTDEELSLDTFRPDDRVAGSRTATYVTWRALKNPVSPMEVVGVFGDGGLVGYTMCTGLKNGAWEIREYRFKRRAPEAMAAALGYLQTRRNARAVTISSFDPSSAHDLPMISIPRGRTNGTIYVHGTDEAGLPCDAARWAATLVDSDW